MKIPFKNVILGDVMSNKICQRFAPNLSTQHLLQVSIHYNNSQSSTGLKTNFYIIMLFGLGGNELNF